MNNDIWSVREEPLEIGWSITLCTLEGYTRPKPYVQFLFINPLLKRAWKMRTQFLRDGNLFAARPIEEVRYEDVISNRKNA